jgi:uncharacterized protein (TIGR02996 family)
MSDANALLDAIRAEPDDDLPRLAYADWLEEHDQADRAAFIRLQCEAARLPAHDRQRRAREKAAEALLRPHKAEWFGLLWKQFHSSKVKVSQLVLDRGFITELRGDARVVLKCAADIERFAPVLRRLEVKHTLESAGPLLDLPLLRRVPELSLGRLDAAGLRLLVKHPGWKGLDRLGLDFEFSSTSETLAGLGDARLVRSAGRLDLYFGYFLRDDEVPEVGLAEAQAPTARELAGLDLPHLRGLGFWGLTSESAAALAGWRGLKRLDWLDFHTAYADDHGVVTLLSAPGLPRLRRLDLNENHLQFRAARAVASCDRLGELAALALDWNDLTDSAAEVLARSATLPQSLDLDVSCNRLTDQGVQRLRERFGPGVVSAKQF